MNIYYTNANILINCLVSKDLQLILNLKQGRHSLLVVLSIQNIVNHRLHVCRDLRSSMWPMLIQVLPSAHDTNQQSGNRVKKFY